MTVIKQDELKDYIKDNVDLYDYISTFYSHINFKRSGKSQVACCPLPGHSENTGSFHVNINDNYYKCFGCGGGGDIFNFVMIMEGLDFADAITLIADNLGLSVEKKLRHLPEKQSKYFKSILEHNKRYHNNLSTNIKALEYLTNTRKISEETIKNFYLGVTDVKEYRWRENNLNGFINESITFPIFLNSPNKEIVANGYKPLDKNAECKYINDGATTIKKLSDYEFKKSEHLYGYPQAYKYIKATKTVYLVEGYFDVISMHESNIKNTLGIMCADLSDSQIDTIKKIANKVVLMFDNDIAGEKAKETGIIKLLKNGLEVEVFKSKHYKDSDDICKRFNFIKEDVTEYISNNSYDAVLYCTNDLLDKYETNLLKMQKDVYTKAMEIINLNPDGIEKSLHIARLKKRIDLK